MTFKSKILNPSLATRMSFLRKQESRGHPWIPAFAGMTSHESRVTSHRRRILCFVLGVLMLTACTSNIFDPIGSNMSSPISVAVDTTTNRAYVVNSNLEYSYTQGSIMVLDITDPAAPVLLSNVSNPAATKNYSGQIYFAPATLTAYIPNRESEDRSDEADQLLVVNLNEVSGSFMSVTEYAAEKDPFAVACCDSGGRIYTVASGSGTLNRYDPADPSSYTSFSLNVSLVVDEETANILGTGANEMAILGDQAFVSAGGIIYVINLTEVGVSGTYPIDYVIGEYTAEDDVDSLGTAHGIAAANDANGNPWLYVIQTSSVDDTNQLLIIDAASLVVVDPDSSSPGQVEVTDLISAIVDVGGGSSELTIFDSDGDTFVDRAYVTNRDDDTISVIDLVNKELVTTITLANGSFTSDEPYGLSAFTHGNGSSYLYVTNLASNNISIVDLATNAVIATYP